MKTNRFLMHGMIILGILMLMGAASADITVTPSVTKINLYTPTDINLTLSVPANVTISGAGITEQSGDSAPNDWIEFQDVTATSTGYIYIIAKNASGALGTAKITAGRTTSTRRYMVYVVAPEEPLAGDEVTITVTDRSSERGVEDVEVDIFLDREKVAYGLTDDDGVFAFTPKETAEYDVDLSRSNYRPEEFVITVAGEAAATTTTTTAAVTTTTEAETTTTEAVTTTTEAETTTTAAVTTTTQAPAVTTTTEAPAVTTTTLPDEGGGLPIVWIAVIVVILIVVIYFVAVKGKGGAAEAPAEEAPAEEAAEEKEE